MHNSLATHVIMLSVSPHYLAITSHSITFMLSFLPTFHVRARRDLPDALG